MSKADIESEITECQTQIEDNQDQLRNTDFDRLNQNDTKIQIEAIVNSDDINLINKITQITQVVIDDQNAADKALLDKYKNISILLIRNMIKSEALNDLLNEINTIASNNDITELLAIVNLDTGFLSTNNQQQQNLINLHNENNFLYTTENEQELRDAAKQRIESFDLKTMIQGEIVNFPTINEQRGTNTGNREAFNATPGGNEFNQQLIESRIKSWAEFIQQQENHLLDLKTQRDSFFTRKRKNLKKSSAIINAEIQAVENFLTSNKTQFTQYVQSYQTCKKILNSSTITADDFIRFRKELEKDWDQAQAPQDQVNHTSSSIVDSNALKQFGFSEVTAASQGTQLGAVTHNEYQPKIRASANSQTFSNTAKTMTLRINHAGESVASTTPQQDINNLEDNDLEQAALAQAYIAWQNYDYIKNPLETLYAHSIHPEYARKLYAALLYLKPDDRVKLDAPGASEKFTILERFYLLKPTWNREKGYMPLFKTQLPNAWRTNEGERYKQRIQSARIAAMTEKGFNPSTATVSDKLYDDQSPSTGGNTP